MAGAIVAKYRPPPPKFQSGIQRFAAGAAFSDGLLISMRLTTSEGRGRLVNLVILILALALGFVASTINRENGNASTKAMNMTVAVTVVAVVGILAGWISPRAPELMTDAIYAVVIILAPATFLFLVTHALFDETFAPPRITSAAAIFYGCLMVVLVFGILG